MGRFVYNLLCFAVGIVVFYLLAWYYAYRSMCHKPCCFVFSRAFWNPVTAVVVEWVR